MRGRRKKKNEDRRRRGAHIASVVAAILYLGLVEDLSGRDIGISGEDDASQRERISTRCLERTNREPQHALSATARVAERVEKTDHSMRTLTAPNEREQATSRNADEKNKNGNTD